jgi:hypothetical protein
MLDLSFIAVGLAAFALTWGLALLCARLGAEMP